jgi:hypothetical protein
MLSGVFNDFNVGIIIVNPLRTTLKTWGFKYMFNIRMGVGNKNHWCCQRKCRGCQQKYGGIANFDIIQDGGYMV